MPSIISILALAERGAFTTKPNPMVGCTIVRADASDEGGIVGEGWHARAGQAHAEVLALAAAGDAARGATAYVTLEPCAHTGKTGPCAEALIAAGVGRVVAAMRDPFPRVDGAGFERLHAAGIEVASGLMEPQARALNRGFFSRVERGRPWLRVKLAMSLDGRTALANGDSKWISGEASRRDVMRWRARAGALLTGAGTVLADDPQLTVRFEGDAEGRVKKLHAVRVGPAPKFEPIPGTEFTLDAELVLLAMGFTGPVRPGIIQSSGMELDARGNVKTDNYQSSIPGVFAAGDVRRGQSLVVWAIAEGRQAAAAVDAYLAR